MSANAFEVYDKKFDAAKAADATLTFARYALESHVAQLKAGAAHPTLGQKMTNGRDWRMAGKGEYQRIAQTYQIKPHHHVVDYGCGSLRVGLHFIEMLEAGHFIGLDVKIGMIDFGVDLLGADFMTKYQPELFELNDLTVDFTSYVGADFLYSTACAFQVHPEDQAEYLGNLRKITWKKGSHVIFDTKLAPDAFRYRSSAWVWTLDYYKAAFSDYDLVSDIKISEHNEQSRPFEGRLLGFRRR
jgi:SAM-dependent methyltransferase